MPDHDDLPNDTHRVARVLGNERPQLDALELDALKRRALRGSRTTGTTNHKGTIMRSRTAITTLLASGVLLSGGGTALGVTALQDTNDAGTAQYGTSSQTPTAPQSLGGSDEPEVAGVQEESPATETAAEPGGEVLGESVSSPNPVQAPRQVASISGDSLPFTGYAAIPVLLMGLGLFAGGLLMRRRSAQL